MTLLAEPTVDDLILAIEPDFQAKGTEYTNTNVPEKETVESYGGKVRLVPFLKGYSTTAIEREIQRKSITE